MTDPAVPFWNFSLRVYRQANVADACLELQDRNGADVNVALFLLWHASEGRALAPAEVARVEALVADWRQLVVVLLRQVRRSLKDREADPGVAALRRQVKQAELEAERLQQDLLYRDAAALGHAVPDRAAAARGNLAIYGAQLGNQFPDGPVETLIAAAVA